MRNLETSNVFIGAKNLVELGMNPPSCLQLPGSFEIDIINLTIWKTRKFRLPMSQTEQGCGSHSKS